VIQRNGAGLRADAEDNRRIGVREPTSFGQVCGCWCAAQFNSLRFQSYGFPDLETEFWRKEREECEFVVGLERCLRGHSSNTMLIMMVHEVNDPCTGHVEIDARKRNQEAEEKREEKRATYSLRYMRKSPLRIHIIDVSLR
jgi:hypothetical protein